MRAEGQAVAGASLFGVVTRRSATDDRLPRQNGVAEALAAPSAVASWFPERLAPAFGVPYEED